MTDEEWQSLIDYWLDSGHDIRHLDIPLAIAKKLGTKMPYTDDDIPFSKGGTSAEAAERLTNADKARHQVYVAIAESKNQGLTREQIEEVTSIEGNTVRPRVCELLGNSKKPFPQVIGFASFFRKTKANRRAEVLLTLDIPGVLREPPSTKDTDMAENTELSKETVDQIVRTGAWPSGVPIDPLTHPDLAKRAAAYAARIETLTPVENAPGVFVDSEGSCVMPNTDETAPANPDPEGDEAAAALRAAEIEAFNKSATERAQQKHNENRQAAEAEAEQTATEVPADQHSQFKKKKYFDGTQCGMQGCSKKLPVEGSYIQGIKPTKNNDNGRLWFGPACGGCTSPLRPNTLAELASQHIGASALALVLDIEVGDVHKRLAAVALDVNGRPLTHDDIKAEGIAVMQQTLATNNTLIDAALNTAENVTPAGFLKLKPVIDDLVPVAYIEGEMAKVQATIAFLGTFHIHTQKNMDDADAWTRQIKSMRADLDAMRLKIRKPHSDAADIVQGYFKPALDAMKMAEGLLKQKITEGNARAAQTQQAALQTAQAAHAAGNMPLAAHAAAQVAQADIVMPAGLSSQSVIKFEISDPSQVPTELWSSFVDPDKVQARINAGIYQIPGVRVWQEEKVSSRSNP